MPGFYAGGEFDIAGFVVGVRERFHPHLPFLDRIVAGDVVIGLLSSGIHSNGFSLVREILENSDISLTDQCPWDSRLCLGDFLLKPTKIYVSDLLPVLRSGLVKGAAHITGGGLVENIPRILPSDAGVHLDAKTWTVHEVSSQSAFFKQLWIKSYQFCIFLHVLYKGVNKAFPQLKHTEAKVLNFHNTVFKWIMKNGYLSSREMLRTFNCGLGIVLIVDENNADLVLGLMKDEAFRIGAVVPWATNSVEPRVKVTNFELEQTSNDLDKKVAEENCVVDGFVENRILDNKIRVAVLISGGDIQIEWLEPKSWLGVKQWYCSSNPRITGEIEPGKVVSITWRNYPYRAKVLVVKEKKKTKGRNEQLARAAVMGARPFSCSPERTKRFPLVDPDFVPGSSSSDSDEELCNAKPKKLACARRILADESDSDEAVHTEKMPESFAVETKNVDEEVVPDSESDEGSSLSEKKSRKRPSNRENWKRNMMKTARQAGLMFRNEDGEILVQPKEPNLSGLLCTENCLLKCSSILTTDLRLEAFQYYYRLSKKEKHLFLFSCTSLFVPKDRKPDAKHPKSYSAHYSIHIGTQTFSVCRKALCELLQISEKIIKNVIKKNGPPASPQTGKHSNRPNRVSEDSQLGVIKHIKKFPTEESHYSRFQNPNRKYLAPHLSVPAMYELYTKECQDMGVLPVSLNYYQEIFVSQFNLGFSSPKSDTCAKCEDPCANPENMQRHKEAARLAQQLMSDDRELASNTEGLIYITFDLQKTLPLPKLSVSVAFYLWQLCFYNFGIHMVKMGNGTGDGFMYSWTEKEAGRGSEEIVSALLAFSELESIGGEHLIAWSDSCPGQNKNFFVFVFWQYLIYTNRFKKIEHKFPEVGHSMLDSDRDFARIEKKLKKEEKVYSPQRYRELIALSCQKPTCFRVFDLAPGLIQAKRLEHMLGLQRRKKRSW